jgi:ketosteroid isomerase-like protein
MSQDNVEIVREVLDLINRAASGAVDERVFDLLAPDVRLDMSRRTFNPDIYQGYADLRRFRQELNEVWEDFSTTVERIIDAGESVVVIETIRGRGRGSGAEVTHHQSATIWTLREGMVVSIEAYPDPQEALEAVGLPE